MINYVFPVAGDYKITSLFGSRNTLIPGATTNHQGIDIAVPTGTGVLSAFSGKVSDLGYNKSRGYYVEIDSGNGLTSIYQHLSGFVAKLGQSVNAGQKIANSGNTGTSSGPHLHFEIKQDGKAVDPMKYTGSSAGSTSPMVDVDQLAETVKKYWWAIAIGLVGIALIKK